MPRPGPNRCNYSRSRIGKRLDGVKKLVAYFAGTEPPLTTAVADSSKGGTDMIAMTRSYKFVAVLLALVFGVFLMHGGGVNAQRVGTSSKSAEELASTKAQTCRDLGGTTEVHYDMNSDGSVDSITVSCTGDGGKPSTCTFYQG